MANKSGKAVSLAMNTGISLNWRDSILFVLFALLSTGYFFLQTDEHRLVFYGFLVFGIFYLFHRREEINGLYGMGGELFFFSAAFLMLNAVSTLWSESGDIDEYWRAAKTAPFLLLTFAITSSYLRANPNAARYLLGTFLATAVLSAISLLVVNMDSIASSYFVGDGGRVWRLKAFGRGDNENLAGAIYSVSALLLIFCASDVKRSLVVLKFICAFLLLVIVFLTLSRGAMIALVAAYIVTCIARAALLQRIIIWELVVIASTAIFSIVVVLYAPFITSYRIERGTTGRVQIWGDALGYLVNAPIFGNGAAEDMVFSVESKDGGDEIYNHTHNAYLGTLLATGVVGLALYLVLLGLALVKSLELGRARNNFVLFSVLVFGSVFGLVEFGGLYTTLGVEWLVFWFPIFALSAISVKERKAGFISRTDSCIG